MIFYEVGWYCKKWVGGGGKFKGDLHILWKKDDFNTHVQVTIIIAEFPNLKTQVKGVTVFF